MATVLIVGASLAGLRTAEQLSARGADCRIVVVGDEPWMPYNRPPLSKEALRAPASTEVPDLAASLAFRPRAAAGEVEWMLGRRAVAADLARRTVTLHDGTDLTYDGLVVATGLRPRRLPQQAPSKGRYTLRSVDDVVALRAAAGPGTRVVVVGGGFIGCEVADTLHARGCDVTVVEPLLVPMQRGVGPELGAALVRHHRTEGVRFVIGQGVDSLTGADDRVSGVVLDDGSFLEADVVVESIGSHANIEWLQGNGLDLSDGALCDDHLRVEGRPDVVAVGDIARFPNRRFDDVPRRVEHWSMPGETAKRAAATLSAALDGRSPHDEPWTPLPSFWTDQFGLHLQCFGSPGLADFADVVEGDLHDLTAGVAVTYHRGSTHVGTVLVNIPSARHAEFRTALLRPALLV